MKTIVRAVWGLLLVALLSQASFAQVNYEYNSFYYGEEVAMCDVLADTTNRSLTVRLLDADLATGTTDIYRRPLFGTYADWVLMANDLPAGTTSWVDNNVAMGDRWEYQLKRTNVSGNVAIGYTSGVLMYDNSDYQGQMILLVADDVPTALSTKYERLKKDITGDGWLVNELVVPKGFGYDAGDEVVGIRAQVAAIYNAAPANDKPKQLFILGHVPLPRSGQGQQAPDGHLEFSGARGADCYYADIDGIFTDTATYDIPELTQGIFSNFPGDYKWDQDVIPSALEMSFGRVDFYQLGSLISTPELQLLETYLDRLHAYRHGQDGMNWNTNTAFFEGYANSVSSSLRSLPALSGNENIYENDTSNLTHPEWVAENGPFLWYMQNRYVPQVGEWSTYGMNSLVFSSDQSAWGYGDLGANTGFGTIRALLAVNTKCLATLWTTTAVNIFHQAAAGGSLGEALKPVMDNNETNLLLEKTSGEWDTPEWWNRTHFSMHGDPGIRFFRALPPTNLSLAADAVNIEIEWTASNDPDLIGYYLYKSDSELGKYEKVSGLIDPNQTSHTFPVGMVGDWYMVRAVASQVNGSGIFVKPSQACFIEYRGEDADGDGYLANDDCEDENPAINPGVIEVPGNGIDDDCDTLIDEADNDMDGYDSIVDCNDGDPSINPGQFDFPNNGIDEDCSNGDSTLLACQDFTQGPWNFLQNGTNCSAGVDSSQYEVWANEAYWILNASPGETYFIDFCAGYDPATWEALISVYNYDQANDSMGALIAAGEACYLDFVMDAAYQLPDLLIVINDKNNCTVPAIQVDNGLPVFGCLSNLGPITTLVDLTIMLEGVYDPNISGMKTTLNDDGLLPAVHPYTGAPWNVPANPPVASFSADIVDWVLVETYFGQPSTSSSPSLQKEDSQVALLRSNGQIVGLDGVSSLSFELEVSHPHYFVVRHRNHLDILSSIPFTAGNSIAHDFTTGASQAFGQEQTKEMTDGVFALYAGDYVPDGVIQNTDYNQWFLDPSVLNTYQVTDGNLDAVIQATDYDVWFFNKAKLGSIEIQY